jgi:antirestriction protein ArdC
VDFERITASIIQAIEAGAETYRMPWTCSGGAVELPINAISRRAYRGINVLLLWAAAQQKGYASGRWATFQQWRAAGAQVRSGERGTTVLLWKPRGSSASEDEKEPQQLRYLCRSFFVFNADQVGGAPPPVQRRQEHLRKGEVERFFRSIPAEVREAGDRACYVPSTDTILLPTFDQFRSADAYYGVLAHELVHWTGAETRLKRDLEGRFGSEAYAMEELVAELGSAFLSSALRLDLEPRRDHAPYIASWLQVLKHDPRAVFSAAAHAQRAVDFLMELGTTAAVEEAHAHAA